MDEQETSPKEQREADQRLALKQAILAAVDQAPDDMPQAVRTAVLAEALVQRELFTDQWCEACQATTDGMCGDHDRGSDLADEARRHAWKMAGVPDVQV